MKEQGDFLKSISEKMIVKLKDVVYFGLAMLGLVPWDKKRKKSN